MQYLEVKVHNPVHRLIPSRFPPVLIFDWAETPEELEEIALLEGFTNERIQAEYGNIYLVAKNDWISGQGATPLMAAFTYPGMSRFADGSYGVYYAADTLETAIAETRYHRERFLKASKEVACLIQMREYIATVKKMLVDMHAKDFTDFLHPDPNQYLKSQSFAREMRARQIWGLYYPSVRKAKGKCVAIFRPPALSVPVQGCHLDYIWDGKSISEVRIATEYNMTVF